MAIIKAANPLHTNTVDTDNLWWLKRAWDEHSIHWIRRHHPDTSMLSSRVMVAKQVLKCRPYNLPSLVPSAAWLLRFYQEPAIRYNGEPWPSIKPEHQTESTHEYLEWLARDSKHKWNSNHLDLAANSLLATEEFFDGAQAQEVITKSFGLRDLHEFRDSSRSRYVLSATPPTRLAWAWSALASNPAVAGLKIHGGTGEYLRDHIVYEALELLRLYGNQVGNVAPSGFYLARRILEGAVSNPAAPMSVLQDIANTLEPAVQYLVETPDAKPWKETKPLLNQSSKIVGLLSQIYLHPNWTGEVNHWGTYTSPLLRAGITRLTTFAPYPTLFGAENTPDGTGAPKALLEKEAFIKQLISSEDRTEEWEEYVSTYPNLKHKGAFPPPLLVGPGLGYLTVFGEGDDAVPAEWIDLILN